MAIDRPFVAAKVPLLFSVPPPWRVRSDMANIFPALLMSCANVKSTVSPDKMDVDALAV